MMLKYVGSNLGFLFFVFLNREAQMLELVHLNILDTPKMPTGWTHLFFQFGVRHTNANLRN